MQELNFPKYQFKTRINAKGKEEIFDLVRKKFVALSPEEWVRQHLIHFLHTEQNYPLSLMAVEKAFKLNERIKRADIVVYSNSGKSKMIIECKAANIPLNQNVLDQALRYNLKLGVEYLVISNGLHHFCFHLDMADQKINTLDQIPDFKTLINE